MPHRPCPVLAPLPKVVIHRAPWGQIVRQHAPGTPRPQEIEDPIEHLALGRGLGTPARFRLWHQMFDQLPFFIRQVGGVQLSRVHAPEDIHSQWADASFLDIL